MATARGYFDARTRALIRLQLPGGPARLQIDTGFNRHVLIGNLTAGRLGIVPALGFLMLQAAGSAAPFRAQLARVQVTWLNQSRRIDTLVYENEQLRPRGEPDGLLGTGLIHPGRLFLDYLNDVVEISE